jgi:hypothetical protein
VAKKEAGEWSLKGHLKGCKTFTSEAWEILYLEKGRSGQRDILGYLIRFLPQFRR